MNFQEAAKSANHAQRNWLDEPMSMAHAKEFIEIATSMPTKQNVPVYKLIASTDKEFNTFVYNNAVDPKLIEDKDDHGKVFIRNSMVLAPLLFIYIIYKNPEHSVSTSYIGAGISSGAVALTANAKGYKTGFCTCLKEDEILHGLKEKYKMSTLWSWECLNILALGIGKPNPGIDHNVVIRPEDNEQFYVKLHPKETELVSIL